MADTADTEKPEAARLSHGTDGDAVAEDDYPPYHGMSTRKYLATRFTTLKPAMLPAPNPFRLVRMLNRRQWSFFLVALFAWVCCGAPPFPSSYHTWGPMGTNSRPARPGTLSTSSPSR